MCSHKRTSERICIAVLLIVVPNWKQPICPEMGNSLDKWWNAIHQQRTHNLDGSPENIRERCGPPLLPPPRLAGAVAVPRTAGFTSVPAAPGGSERGRGRLRREGRGDSDHALQEPQPSPAGLRCFHQPPHPRMCPDHLGTWATKLWAL